MLYVLKKYHTQPTVFHLTRWARFASRVKAIIDPDHDRTQAINVR